MASGTVRTKAASVDIPGCMTGNTCRSSTCVDAIGMAARTGHTKMFASQLVDRQVVVKGGCRPGCSGMAVGAIDSKPAVMQIFGSMAAITRQRCTSIDTINMTACTGHTGMFAGQLENRQVVVKGGSRPARGGMAGGAIDSKPAVMQILFSMAAITG